MQKGSKYYGREKKGPSSLHEEAAHYSQMYDGNKCISGEMLCASHELFSLFAPQLKMNFLMHLNYTLLH